MTFKCLLLLSMYSWQSKGLEMPPKHNYYTKDTQLVSRDNNHKKEVEIYKGEHNNFKSIDKIPEVLNEENDHNNNNIDDSPVLLHLGFEQAALLRKFGIKKRALIVKHGERAEKLLENLLKRNINTQNQGRYIHRKKKKSDFASIIKNKKLIELLRRTGSNMRGLSKTPLLSWQPRRGSRLSISINSSVDLLRNKLLRQFHNKHRNRTEKRLLALGR